MKYLIPIILFVAIINIIFCFDPPIVPSDLPSSCCSYPNFQNPRLLQWCRSKYQKNGMTKYSEGCANECFFNTSKIWQREQPIRQSVMTAFTKFTPNQWRKLMVWSINYCLSKYKSLPPIPVNPLLRMMPIGNPDCNEGPYMMVQCIAEQLLRYCPAQNFRATPQCRQKRQEMNSISS